MSIIVKIVSIETHHSIEIMKRYHESLRQAYSIISTEISEIDFELALQMTFKVINDSIELNDLISTLLMFEAYLRMIEMNVSSSTITQRAIAMKNTMNEIRKFNVIRQMNNVLNIKNESSINLIHDLSLNFSVLVFRESNNQSRSWKEFFKLLSIQSESAIIELSNESIKFRSTSIKSYYQNDDHANDENSSSSSNIVSFIEFENNHLAIDSIVFIESSKRERDRLRKCLVSIAYLNFILNSITADSSFIASRQQKIAELLEKEIFLSVNKTEMLFDVRIFSFRFVNEIKHSGTDKAFEKFRLVVQAFKNQNKILVLIQSSIIQRVSQRLIICLAVTFSQSMNLYLRNIIQTYVQSRSTLNRNFYVQSSSKLIKLMRIFNDCILKVIKSLYDVSKADNHWFKTYHDHHIDKLDMIQFTYDSCLLYIIDRICIEIVSMQTNDTLILADQSFAVVEKEAVHSAKIMTKTREQLTLENSLKFNDTRIERIDSNEAIYFRQETHIQDIQLIQSIDIITTNVRSKMRIKLISKEQYVTQRTREVYLTSICQSKASFDLSRAAQLIEYSSDDIISLNKRLIWQIANQIRRLRYVKLNQSFLQLVVFTNSSFANNHDSFSQIEYVICLIDTTHANILHWFSIKCKRVTRSVLTAELFAMIHDFDVESILKTILNQMLRKKISISLILIIDSKSLYDCLIRLGIIVEKRLMIDVMILRQFYERKEITEVK